MEILETLNECCHPPTFFLLHQTITKSTALEWATSAGTFIGARMACTGGTGCGGLVGPANHCWTPAMLSPRALLSQRALPENTEGTADTADRLDHRDRSCGTSSARGRYQRRFAQHVQDAAGLGGKTQQLLETPCHARPEGATRSPRAWQMHEAKGTDNCRMNQGGTELHPQAGGVAFAAISCK